MTGIPSPCIRVCVLDPRTDLCIGCGRLRSEIAGWSARDDAERRRILAELPRRLRRMTSREIRGRARRTVSAVPENG